MIEAAIGDRESDVSFSFRTDPTDPGGFAKPTICAGRHPHLIKVDVEGAELLALRGARETLSRWAPVVVVAIHPEPMRLLRTSPTELVAFVAACGYRGHHLNGRRALDPGFEEIIFTKQSGAE